jgi:azurin
MKNNTIKSLLAVFALSMLTIVSCNNEPKTETKEEVTTVEEPASPAHADTIQLTLNGDDNMKYDKTEFDVFAGQTVVLTLNHIGKMPITSMGHNFVLLENGFSVDEFATSALEAKDNGYIPTNGKGMIAHTKLIGGGESTSVTFTAPAQGTYDYLCSFPGHHGMMKGVFNVK